MTVKTATDSLSEWITTDGQSASLSWCRAPSGAHDQILIIIWLLLFFFDVGRPLWREVGSVICLHQSCSLYNLGTDRIENTVSQFFYCYMRIRCRRHVFIGHYLATAFLLAPSFWLPAIMLQYSFRSNTNIWKNSRIICCLWLHFLKERSELNL
jgi:hypothetical protein